MQWKLDKKRPICPQIVEQICVGMAGGEFQPGERLMSVRDVALAAGVNPNTVQKAFEQLEQMQLIRSVRGSGWYVAEDFSLAQETAAGLIRQKTADFFGQMALLGLDEEQVKRYVKEWRA